MNNKNNTIFSLIEEISDKTPNEICLRSPERNDLSFNELVLLIKKTQYELSVENKSHIAIILPNTVELATVFLSIVSFSVAIPLNPSISIEDLKYHIKELNISVIITDDCFLSKNQENINQENIKVFTIKYSPTNISGDFSLHNSNNILNSKKEEIMPSSPKDIAFILTTSGTTSRPKFVPIRQDIYCQHLLCIKNDRKLGKSDTYLNFAYLFHIHGINGFCIPIISSGSCVLSNREHTILNIKYFEKYKPTFYSALPTQHQYLVNEAKLKNKKYHSSLRGIITGSTSISKKLCQDIELIFNAPIIHTYGMTETLGISSLPLLPQIYIKNHDSVGLPLGDIKINIVKHHQCVDPLIEGSIFIESPWLFSGYLIKGKIHKEKISKFGFCTGDMGYLDNNGYLYLTGRKKDIINQGGEKISPFEIENVILSLEYIKEVVVFPISDSRLGEIAVAAIILNKITINNNIIKKHLHNKLPNYKIPQLILFVSEIPKSPIEKIQRNLLEKYYTNEIRQAKKNTNISNHNTIEDIKELWKKILFLDDKDIDYDTSFFHLGGDSFSFIQLTIEIERLFSIKIDILEGHTLREQEKFINNFNILKYVRKNPSSLCNDDYHRLVSFSNKENTVSSINKHPLITSYNTSYPNIPLFFIGGNKYLAAHLKNHPLYSAYSGYDVIKLNESNIKSLVDYYVNAILEIKPSKNYLLGGYCSGGLIAYKIAKELIKKGKEVPILFLVDQELPFKYKGNISFILFNNNKFIGELERLKNSKILNNFYKNWTLDIIDSPHAAELSYTSSMFIAERIQSRTQQIFRNSNNIPPLLEINKNYHLNIILSSQTQSTLTFTLILTNLSKSIWGKSQISIINHWLSKDKVLIEYSNNELTIINEIKPNHKYSINYTIDRLYEPGKFILAFGLKDNFGSIFKKIYPINVEMEAHRAYNLNEISIAKLENIGKLGNLICYYINKSIKTSDDIIKLSKHLSDANRDSESINNLKNININNLSKNNKIKVLIILLENYTSLSINEKSIIYARKILEIKPSYDIATYYLSVSYMKQGDNNRSINILLSIFDDSHKIYSSKILYGLRNFITKYHKLIKNSDLYYLSGILINNHHILCNSIPYLINSKRYFLYKNYKQSEIWATHSKECYSYLSQTYNYLYKIKIKEGNILKAVYYKSKVCSLKPFSTKDKRELRQITKRVNRISK